MSERSLVLLSRSVFTGLSDEPMNGFVAIRGNRIEAVGPASQAAPYAESAEEVRDMGPRTIMAGLVDVHTFFTGWVLRRTGADLSGAATPAGVVEALLAWGLEHEGAPVALGRDLPEALLGADLDRALDQVFAGLPAVAFTEGAGTCALNAAARERYGFTPMPAMRRRSGGSWPTIFPG